MKRNNEGETAFFISSKVKDILACLPAQAKFQRSLDFLPSGWQRLEKAKKLIAVMTFS